MLTHEERSKIAREAALRYYAKETPEQKAERIRKAKGRNKGRHHTEESKQKIREARDRLLNDLVLNSKKKIHKNLKLITLWEDDIKTNPNLVKESLNEIIEV